MYTYLQVFCGIFSDILPLRLEPRNIQNLDNLFTRQQHDNGYSVGKVHSSIQTNIRKSCVPIFFRPALSLSIYRFVDVALESWLHLISAGSSSLA